VLLAPVERQIKFYQPGRGELGGLAALQDRFDQLRAQEGEVDQTPDVAPGDPFPGDHRRITFRVVVRLCSSGQHQLGLNTAPPEGDRRLELERSIARDVFPKPHPKAIVFRMLR
jgi:hypothetical protein